MPIHQLSNSGGNYNYNAVTYRNCEWQHHFHGNFEIIYVIEGEITATVDFVPLPLRAGDFAMILPNQMHAFTTPESSLVWIVVFSEDYVFRFASEIHNKVGKNAVFHCEKEISELVRRYLITEGTKDISMRIACLSALCFAYGKGNEWRDRIAGNDGLLFGIVRYVADHFTEPITLKGMADDLNFEYHYLSRRFHSIFGMNFCRFVNQYRIVYADELIREGGRSMTEVAFKCGFQNVRSFNSAYRLLNGGAPKNKSRR